MITRYDKSMNNNSLKVNIVNFIEQLVILIDNGVRNAWLSSVSWPRGGLRDWAGFGAVARARAGPEDGPVRAVSGLMRIE